MTPQPNQLKIVVSARTKESRAHVLPDFIEAASDVEGNGRGLVIFFASLHYFLEFSCLPQLLRVQKLPDLVRAR